MDDESDRADRKCGCVAVGPKVSPLRAETNRLRALFHFRRLYLLHSLLARRLPHRLWLARQDHPGMGCRNRS